MTPFLIEFIQIVAGILVLYLISRRAVDDTVTLNTVLVGGMVSGLTSNIPVGIAVALLFYYAYPDTGDEE
jgi:hypothetical protein